MIQAVTRGEGKRVAELRIPPAEASAPPPKMEKPGRQRPLTVDEMLQLKKREMMGRRKG